MVKYYNLARIKCMLLFFSRPSLVPGVFFFFWGGRSVLGKVQGVMVKFGIPDPKDVIFLVVTEIQGWGKCFSPLGMVP